MLACLCALVLSQPSAFPLCLTSGSPPMCPRSSVPSGHPTCALWCRSSTPVLDRLLWLLTVSVGLANRLHCLSPALALPPEQRGWPVERCDTMLSWHPDTSSDPVSRRNSKPDVLWVAVCHKQWRRWCGLLRLQLFHPPVGVSERPDHL